MNDLSDIQLLEQFRHCGNAPEGAAKRQQLFRVLVVRYQKKLYWHIRRMLVDHDDTDDVLQNTFIKVWRALDGFKEDAQLYTWLYRIATNETLSFIRQRKTELHVRYGDVEYTIESKLADSNNFSGDEIQRKLQLAIQTLPEKQRLVFNMKYFEEMRYEEMSAVLDTSVGALKASYHHAVKKIEAYIRNTNPMFS